MASQLLLSTVPANRVEVLSALGELMFQSHAGYSAIGLGCPQTDAMVEEIRKHGAGQGFYGARVSGGGSGGTVVMLLERSALTELEGTALSAEISCIY